MAHVTTFQVRRHGVEGGGSPKHEILKLAVGFFGQDPVFCQ